MRPRRTIPRLPPGLASVALAVAIGIAGAAALLAWATPCEPGHLCSLLGVALWRTDGAAPDHGSSCDALQRCAHALDLEADSGLADLLPTPVQAPAPLNAWHTARSLARRPSFRAWWALWLCVGLLLLAGCGGNACADDDASCSADTADQQPVRCDLYPQRCV